MKRRTKTERRPRPKLRRILEEMRQWSDLLLREILGWQNVRSRPMFGMTAVYRGNAIFGVLPRTRAMDTPYSVSFKILSRNPSLQKRLEADLRILPSTRDAKDLIRAAIGRGPTRCDPLVCASLPTHGQNRYEIASSPGRTAPERKLQPARFLVSTHSRQAQLR